MLNSKSPSSKNDLLKASSSSILSYLKRFSYFRELEQIYEQSKFTSEKNSVEDYSISPRSSILRALVFASHRLAMNFDKLFIEGRDWREVKTSSLSMLENERVENSST